VVNRALDLAAPALILVHNHVNQKDAIQLRDLDTRFSTR
jgi:DNA repair protein RadC